MTDLLEADAPKRIVIPYTPRKHFMPMHASPRRFKFVVAHRRAGKSVSEINEVIKRALQNERKYPPPRYAYVGPSFAQTKDLIWGYAKHYSAPLPDVVVSEGDLQLTLSNGAMVNLYGGSSAYERMRGLYFDGIVLDEFPLLNPAVFSTVVRPCLADYRGWAIVSGTSNGDDHFHALKKKAEQDPDWDIFIIPVTETDALHPDEVIEMTKDMSPEEYAREMLCSFDAPIEGAYYAARINDLQLQGRITGVPYQPAAQVFTWWDLGIDDYTAIWFVQFVGKEIHVIDYLQESGKSLADYAQLLQAKPYVYAKHVMPHDIKARELGTGVSRKEIAAGLLGEDSIHISPDGVGSPVSVADGIEAVKSILPMCWFNDIPAVQRGLSALKNYSRNAKSGLPIHNWASHGADGFRTGAQSINYVHRGLIGSGYRSQGGRLRRRIRGMV